ncbi:MAG: hypothetical protein KDA96_21475, partial [Planctomycetaceae bacterium]|nr:hypothetical protein [Planctomycetaceae bacterium]
MRRGIQLAVACLVLLVTAAVQAGVVYTNDFQSGTATGFTGFTNVETAPNTERFIGFLVSGNSAVLSLSGLAPHSTVTLEFDVIGLHSLDGITSGDNFQLFRNGGLEFTDFYGHSGGTIIGPTTGTLLSDDPSAFGYGSFFAGAVTYHYSLIFNDSASSISFAFQGNTNQTWNDEAFGLDN